MGFCRTIFKCRVCGKIYGGVVDDGVVLYCKYCAKRKFCNLDETKVECDNNTICWNTECWYKELMEKYKKDLERQTEE